MEPELVDFTGLLVLECLLIELLVHENQAVRFFHDLVQLRFVRLHNLPDDLLVLVNLNGLHVDGFHQPSHLLAQLAEVALQALVFPAFLAFALLFDHGEAHRQFCLGLFTVSDALFFPPAKAIISMYNSEQTSVFECKLKFTNQNFDKTENICSQTSKLHLNTRIYFSEAWKLEIIDSSTSFLAAPPL